MKMQLKFEDFFSFFLSLLLIRILAEDQNGIIPLEILQKSNKNQILLLLSQASARTSSLISPINLILQYVHFCMVVGKR